MSRPLRHKVGRLRRHIHTVHTVQATVAVRTYVRTVCPITVTFTHYTYLALRPMPCTARCRDTPLHLLLAGSKKCSVQQPYALKCIVSCVAIMFHLSQLHHKANKQQARAPGTASSASCQQCSTTGRAQDHDHTRHPPPPWAELRSLTAGRMLRVCGTYMHTLEVNQRHGGWEIFQCAL